MWRENVFDLPPNHVIDVSCDIVGGDSLVLSRELAKFRIHRRCESGDITFFICHDIERSRDFVGGILSP